jgi:methylase of polypeptide subunit release factors
VFGWNRPFRAGDIDHNLLDLLRSCDGLRTGKDGLRSTYRAASLGDDIFLHSGFPTDQADAVFFGPDSYRFVRFIREQMPQLPADARIADMGAGSGAGGIVAARLAPGCRVTLVDTNPKALELAGINAAAAGVEVETLHSDEVPAGIDLAIANPPYMMDDQHRTYRHGGDLLGGAVALDWAKQALRKLNPGGAMLLYTGAAFEDGRAPLIEALAQACMLRGAAFGWQELDPDVFGEELRKPAYASVERISAVRAVIRV